MVRLKKMSRFFKLKKGQAPLFMWSPSKLTNRLSDLLPWERFRTLSWGSWALINLYLSLLSGILLGLQYDFHEPFFTTTTIEVVVPFGRFFRSLHFYSSQLFFLLTCAHLIAVFHKSANYSRKEWYKIMGTLPVIILLLFTGYVLRGDSTGYSAGMIAENIVQTFPFLGTLINSLLFDISQTGLRKVYVHHVITLDIIFLMLAWYHLRIFRVRLSNHLVAIALLLLFSLFIAAPIEPARLGVDYIGGPWFFLGLQELLRYFPPLIAGILVPTLCVLLLLRIHPAQDQYRRRVFQLLVFLCCYLLLTIVAWNR
jgi:quinol-cytochrome oxidoreductase complex cytochrome b subunit